MCGTEGVIQFELEHSQRPIAAAGVDNAFAELAAWRQVLRATGLVGRDPERYEGYAYGNLSLRIGGHAFLITGSQTSGKEPFTLADCALVDGWDTRANRVTSHGGTEPSSESLSHAAVYDLASHTGAVVHAHAPALWRHAGKLGVPIIDPGAANGTPAMAAAIQRCWRRGALAACGVLAMGGHQDGVLACGRSLEEAGQALLKWQVRALRLSSPRD